MGYLMKVYKIRKLQIPRKFLEAIKYYESEKKKQIKNGGGGGGGGGGDTLKQSKLGHWEQEFKSIETRAKDELKKKVE